MRLLLVNTTAGGGSVPSHIRLIAESAVKKGHEVTIAYGRGSAPANIPSIRIGSFFSTLSHVARSRLTDRHGLYSRCSTLLFIKEAEKFNPDIIHLHNIHGYYLHYPTLFKWLRESERPVIWSLHDCWAFTGHCASISGIGTECSGYVTNCGNCPMLRHYPAAWTDRSFDNLTDKRNAFTSLERLTLISSSDWLADKISKSFLSGIPRRIIPIDINLHSFYPDNMSRRPVVLGVANRWSELKGLEFFFKLRNILPGRFEIRLIGPIERRLPAGIVSLGRIDDLNALRREYSQATLFVNPTHAETYSMTNREALACGTPVVTRKVGGATEGLAEAPLWSAIRDEDLLKLVLDKVTELSEAPVFENASKVAANFMRDKFAEQPGITSLFKIYETLLEH